MTAVNVVREETQILFLWSTRRPSRSQMQRVAEALAPCLVISVKVSAGVSIPRADAAIAGPGVDHKCSANSSCPVVNGVSGMSKVIPHLRRILGST